jgi:cation transport ATPase
MKTYTFQVQGMHCAACVLLTESELEALPNIITAKANLASCSVDIIGNFATDSPQVIAAELTQTLKPHGYTLLTEKNKLIVIWSDFKIALPIALGIAILFLLLQKLGIVNFITINKVNFGTAFIIGLVASVSTCMAVVGGLVLSMSANMAKEGEKKKPQILFHIGRLSFLFLPAVCSFCFASLQLTIKKGRNIMEPTSLENRVRILEISLDALVKYLDDEVIPCICAQIDILNSPRLPGIKELLKNFKTD